MVTKRDVGLPDETGGETKQRSVRRPDFGLAVGVDHYVGLPPLMGAVTDATQFHTWMCDKEGGGVLSDHARLVTSSPKPPKPVQQQVDEALVDLTDVAKEIGGGGRLYFHFSGHGAMTPNDDSEDVALLLATWSRIYSEIALSSHDYRDRLVSPGLFREVAIFLDCCRSPGAKAIAYPPTFDLKCTTPIKTKWLIAYATENGDAAFEVPGKVGWQGVFTNCLLSILSTSQSALNVDALRRALNQRIRRGQSAVVIDSLDPNSTFGKGNVICRLEITFVDMQGRVWLQDANNYPIGEHKVGAEPWVLWLKPGVYKLETPTEKAVEIVHPAAEVIDHGRWKVTSVGC